MNFGGILCIALLLLTTAACRVDPPVSESQPQLDPRAPMEQENVMRTVKQSDTEIVLTRIFAAPREAVFAALTQEEHLVHWMNLSDTPLLSCKVDLRVGGSFRHVFQRPVGRKVEVRGAYEAVDPPRGFVHRETYDFSPLEMLVTTALEVANGKTVFKQTLGYSSKRERDGDFDAVATSASEAYAKLERYLTQTCE